MFVVTRKITRDGFSVFAFTSVPSFRHGVPEPRFTWMSPEASLRAWMPAVHAGMTDAVP
jgi:hypothetical protein